MARGGDKSTRPIIIKKVKKVAGGHHGGAWKVAYADFVTAMMAFFMLLWLLSVSDEVSLTGLADYFTPTNATMSNNSGSGQILAGTALEKEGAKSSGAVALTAPSSADQHEEEADEIAVSRTKADSEYQSKLPPTRDAQLAQIEDDIKTAIQETPELKKFRDQIVMEETPEGLRIQLIDRDQRPMFKPASAELYPFAEALFRGLAGVVQGLPNRVAIFGHTDAAPGSMAGGYTNWELSADRANTARRVLVGGGVGRDRVSEVVGKAETDPLYPDAPERPENRRIALLLLREAPVLSPEYGR